MQVTAFTVFAFAALWCAMAAPQAPPHVVPPGAARFAPGAFVPIVSQNFDINPDGSYNFQYASADGSSRQESGALRNPGTIAESNAVTGSYSYIADDGTPITVNYIADENGFQPEGNSINPAITRSVAAQVQEAAAVRAGVVPLPGHIRSPLLPGPSATVSPVLPPRPPPPVNPALYNPGLYNPALHNPALHNPALYNPSLYNPALYRGYPGYRGFNPYYNPSFPGRVFPTQHPGVEAAKA